MTRWSRSHCKSRRRSPGRQDSLSRTSRWFRCCCRRRHHNSDPPDSHASMTTLRCPHRHRRHRRRHRRHRHRRHHHHHRPCRRKGSARRAQIPRHTGIASQSSRRLALPTLAHRHDRHWRLGPAPPGPFPAATLPVPGSAHHRLHGVRRSRRPACPQPLHVSAISQDRKDRLQRRLAFADAGSVMLRSGDSTFDSPAMADAGPPAPG